MTIIASMRPSDLVASRIREMRHQRKWSAKDLARQCAATGSAELTDAVIANIETGRPGEGGRRRRDVTVEELMAFARAFSVPLSALLPMADLEAASQAVAVQDDAFAELLLRALGRPDIRNALSLLRPGVNEVNDGRMAG
jgi:transcriptional regulator with XRE-family HTH domain